jgi:hypothetical protein
MKEAPRALFCEGKLRLAAQSICLLGLLLFLSLAPATTYGAVPPTALIYGYNDPYDPYIVNWSVKTHQFTWPKHKSLHTYHFQGLWKQPFSYPYYGKLDIWMDVTGSYDMATKRFTEEAVFKSVYTTGLTGVREIKLSSSGSHPLDPWLIIVSPLSDIKTNCTVDRLTGDDGQVYSNKQPYAEPPMLISRWAFTQAEREFLWKEDPAPPTCTDDQLRQPPTVVIPTPNQFISNYKSATLAVEMPCRPPSQSSANRFNYVLEKLSDLNGTEGWLPICDPCMTPMMSNQYTNVTKGLRNLNLEHHGRYRIKVNQQVQTEANVIAVASTDWIYFSTAFGTAQIGNVAEIKTVGQNLGNSPKPVLVAPEKMVSQMPTAPAQPVALADLVVKLSIGTEQFLQDGETWYKLYPKWTITNTGKADSGGFYVKLESQSNNQIWHSLSDNYYESLAPQASMTASSVGSNTYWRVGDSSKPGYRITVDSRATVRESNESNNSSTAYFNSVGTLPQQQQLKKMKRP